MPRQRQDAVRNNAAILQAASELVEEHGPAELRMGDVAERAGVGPGTIYRAFAGRSELLLALLDDRERRLQDAVLRGRPPLGPGAPAGERLPAFLLALAKLNLDCRQILLAADRPGQRSGAHAAWRLHVEMLLTEIDAAMDAAVAAELLLATVSATTLAQLVDGEGRSRAAIRREIGRLLAAYG